MKKNRGSTRSIAVGFGFQPAHSVKRWRRATSVSPSTAPCPPSSSDAIPTASSLHAVADAGAGSASLLPPAPRATEAERWNASTREIRLPGAPPGAVHWPGWRAAAAAARPSGSDSTTTLIEKRPSIGTASARISRSVVLAVGSRRSPPTVPEPLICHTRTGTGVSQRQPKRNQTRQHTSISPVVSLMSNGGAGTMAVRCVPQIGVGYAAASEPRLRCATGLRWRRSRATRRTLARPAPHRRPPAQPIVVASRAPPESDSASTAGSAARPSSPPRCCCPLPQHRWPSHLCGHRSARAGATGRRTLPARNPAA